MPARLRRRLATGGIIGPIGFVAAWVVAGARASHYSAVHDAISRLAAVHASTRLLMTAGFVIFGVGVPLFALALRAALAGPAWVAAAVSGASTLAVAAFPLDAGVDNVHAGSAVVGYITLAATPLLAAATLSRDGCSSAARASRVVGCTSAILLGLSLVGPAPGLFQRTGLGVTDVWISAMAIRLMRTRSDLHVFGGRSTSHGSDDTGGTSGRLRLHDDV